MTKRLLKALLPDRLHGGARSVRWWLRFLLAAALWRFQYVGRGLRSRLRQERDRLWPASLEGLDLTPDGSPEVTVVIPVHDQYRFTARCLRALAAARTVTSFEVVVVDDRSTDATAERLAAVPGLRLVANQGEPGFVHACNLGAQEARGRYVVFLNNDTEVQDDWLDRLVATFEDFSDAGAVGAKLIFPDGRLQEAGGIVWRDGSAWNYGRYMKPDHPRFSYARPVDYCSAACLMIGRSLFEELGGFDVDFAPGYYEDTDLAFRVRDAGYAVYYQPTARVVHHEGATAGRSTDRGMKRYQIEHRDLFVARWHAELASHRRSGVQPELEKERQVEQRLLIVEPRMIRPDRDSGSLRMFNLIRVMRDLGWRITFVPDNLLRIEPYVEGLQAIGVETLYAPYVPSLDAHLTESGRLYDVVILSRLETARRHLDRVGRLAPQAAVVFDTVDLHFLRERREAALIGGQQLERRATQTRIEEIDVANRADATLVVSENERQILLEQSPSLDAFVVSNVHEQFESRCPFEDRRDVLFIGGFEHPPNVDAVRWLVEQIVPEVRRLGLDVTFYIVGSHPPREIRALASDHVVVTGFVEDVGPYFERCRLSVAPLRYGAGVKGKINQSMARGLPVVATAMACEGMGLEHRRDVLVADTAEEFAASIVELYGDRELWNRLVAGGRANIEAFYSMEAAQEAIGRALDFVTSRMAAQRGPVGGSVWRPVQAAAYLKIASEKLLEAVGRGEIPHVEIGGAIRFHREGLEAWVRERSQRWNGSRGAVPRPVAPLRTPAVVWTPEQAAAFLKVSRQQLLEAVARREIPIVDVAGEIRFHSHGLEAWMRQASRRAVEGEEVPSEAFKERV